MKEAKSPYSYWAFDTESRTIVGPRDTEEDINQLAFQTLDADFRIFYLRTHSKPKAVSFIKGTLLEESRELQNSMKRFHHTKENYG